MRSQAEPQSLGTSRIGVSKFPSLDSYASSPYRAIRIVFVVDPGRHFALLWVVVV